MHWQAQCHAKLPRHSRRIQHSLGIEIISPDSLQPVLTTKPLVRITRHTLPLATDFLAYRTVVLGFFNLNIKARHEIREFLNKLLYSVEQCAPFWTRGYAPFAFLQCVPFLNAFLVCLSCMPFLYAFVCLSCMPFLNSWTHRDCSTV